MLSLATRLRSHASVTTCSINISKISMNSLVCRKRSMSSSTSAAAKNQTLYMWGTNKDGTIPGLEDDPSITNKKLLDVPTVIDWKKLLKIDENDTNISLSKVTCGPTSTSFLLNDGRCYMCGSNDQGQLGLGLKEKVVTEPTLIQDVNNVRDVALGKHFSAIIDTDNELYTFGFGGSTLSGIGNLGHGDSESYSAPKIVESLGEDGCFAKEVQVGTSHLAVLTTEGEILTCGSSSFGRLGNLDGGDQLFLEPVELLTSNIEHISCGHSFTLALKDDGVIYCWGKNDRGQLGTGLGLAVDMYSMADYPQPIESDDLLSRKVVHIATGHSHACCITSSGELFYWGSHIFMEPELQRSLLHTKVTDVVCGKDYTIILTDENKAYAFGTTGKTGVLGQASNKNYNQPVEIESLADKNVTHVSAGYAHVACIAEE